MAVVYSLETDGLIWYVGSTARPLYKRLAEHRYRKTVPFDDYDITIRELETCEISTRFTREQYWIHTLNPFYNVWRPGSMTGMTRAQYNKQWASDNRDKVRYYSRQYYARKTSSEQ